LLLDQQGKFLAFGSKAREDYYHHDESGLLFENFKMRLHDDHRGSEPMAFALNGKTVPLLKVITHSLKSVKDDAMVQINLSQVFEREKRERGRETERKRDRETEFIYIPRHAYKHAHSQKNLILSSRVAQVKKLSPFEIKWVVTVPAIWQDVAKVTLRSSCIYLVSCKHQPKGG